MVICLWVHRAMFSVAKHWNHTKRFIERCFQAFRCIFEPILKLDKVSYPTTILLMGRLKLKVFWLKFWKRKQLRRKYFNNNNLFSADRAKNVCFTKISTRRLLRIQHLVLFSSSFQMPKSFKMILIRKSKSSNVIVYFVFVIDTHESSANLMTLSEMKHKILKFRDS